LHEEEQLTPDKAKWFMGEGSLPSFSVAEVQAGLSHPDIIRTEVLTAEKQKQYFQERI
jgi:cytochrome c oxidase subunit 3